MSFPFFFCAGDFFSSPRRSQSLSPTKSSGRKEGMRVLERQKPARKLREAFFVAGFLLLLTAHYQIFRCDLLYPNRFSFLRIAPTTH